jgi:hypothetical protein
VINFKVSGPGFESLIEAIDDLARADMMPLAAEVRGIMIEDNRAGLLAGTNADGSRADDVKESTIRRGRGGDGPPRVPRGAASRMIADYDVEIQQSVDRILLIGGWRNTPFVHFHATGAPKNNMPARDPVGIRPSGQARIAQALADFVDRLMTHRL